MDKSKGEPQLKDAQLYFEGADLKKAYFQFDSKKDEEGLFCSEARLKTSDGMFECKGYIKKSGEKKELTFKFNLEPIKDGFNLKGELKKQQIKLDLIFKKK